MTPSLDPMTRRPVAALLVAGLAALAVVAGSCGGDESALPKIREISIVMTDSKFTPDTIEVKVGETVKLVFTNKGALRHEAVIGDEATQIANEQQMQQLLGASSTIAITPQQARHGRSAEVLAVVAHPGMSAANVVSVEPGATGEITFTFAKAGKLLMGCHEIGHYAAGMVGTINVTA